MSVRFSSRKRSLLRRGILQFDQGEHEANKNVDQKAPEVDTNEQKQTSEPPKQGSSKKIKEYTEE